LPDEERVLIVDIHCSGLPTTSILRRTLVVRRRKWRHRRFHWLSAAGGDDSQTVAIH
jgi:hypothetical protein